jgi:hypothetical protein
LNPLFTGDDVVFDEKLLGTWLEDANDPGRFWEFARFEESSAEGLREILEGGFERIYRLNWTDGEGHKGSFAACLVKLGERRFLDIFPDQFPSGESNPEKMKLPLTAMFFLRCHMFVRVDSLGDQLKVHAIDDDGFKKFVEAEPKAVTYATTEGGSVLTASSKELQAFVTKYVDDERLFTVDMTLTRKSK